MIEFMIKMIYNKKDDSRKSIVVPYDNYGTISKIISDENEDSDSYDTSAIFKAIPPNGFDVFTDPSEWHIQIEECEKSSNRDIIKEDCISELKKWKEAHVFEYLTNMNISNELPFQKDYPVKCVHDGNTVGVTWKKYLFLKNCHGIDIHDDIIVPLILDSSITEISDHVKISSIINSTVVSISGNASVDCIEDSYIGHIETRGLIEKVCGNSKIFSLSASEISSLIDNSTINNVTNVSNIGNMMDKSSIKMVTHSTITNMGDFSSIESLVDSTVKRMMDYSSIMLTQGKSRIHNMLRYSRIMKFKGDSTVDEMDHQAVIYSAEDDTDVCFIKNHARVFFSKTSTSKNYREYQNNLTMNGVENEQERPYHTI